MILTYLAYALGALALLRAVMGTIAFVRYVRQSNVRRIPKGPTPPLSVLKPVYGTDEGLEDNFVATLRQNYPDFEVLVLHEREDDPALEAVSAAEQRVDDVDVRKIHGRAADVANPKAAVLIRGEEEARHDVLVSADSDVTPDPLYLRDVANGLEEADAVSFLPVLYGTGSLWGRLMALVVNTDALMEGAATQGQMTTGATIAVKRAALEEIGGYRAIADRMADDYALGRELKKAGKTLALARRPARIRVGAAPFSWALRWLRTVRASAPIAFLAWGLFAFTPLVLLLAWNTWTLLAFLVLAVHRICIAVVVDYRYCWDRSLLRALPLLPLLWVLEPLAWLAGWCGNSVVWRGRRYRLKGGRAKVVDP